MNQDNVDKDKAIISEPIGRRSFLGMFIGAVGAIVAGSLAVSGISYGISPGLARRKTTWVELGSVDEFELGKPKLTSFVPPEGDGWLDKPSPRAVYVVNKGGGEFVCFDIRCTHLGCPVQYNPGAKRYFSPCHGGVFDEDGNVVAGPPPRPLDRYRTKVENGKLYVGELYRVG